MESAVLWEKVEVGGVVQKLYRSRRKSGPRSVSVWARVLRKSKTRVVAEVLEDAAAVGLKKGQMVLVDATCIAGYRTPDESRRTLAA